MSGSHGIKVPHISCSSIRKSIHLKEERGKMFSRAKEKKKVSKKKGTGGKRDGAKHSKSGLGTSSSIQMFLPLFRTERHYLQGGVA